MKKVFLITLLFLLVPLLRPAIAVNDSVSSAHDIINGFYAEAESLIDTVDMARLAFRAVALEKKEDILDDLRSIGVAKSPSRERYEEVRGITSRYMDSVISDIEKLKGRIDPKYGPRMDDIAAQLSALKDFKLKALEDSLQIESYEKKGPVRVPVDRERTPFEHPPDQPPGIWFR